MKACLKHPLRVTGRLFWLGGELLLAAASIGILCAFRSKVSELDVRASWMQRSSRRLMQVFGVEPEVTGPIPSSGLLVCNHLSYLDVLVLAALAPSVFVAKHEVKHWPVFGWFARRAGTVFVRREKRTQTKQVTDQIETVLSRGVLVILFPEGTSSGGKTVLPFKSSLLEPATRQMHPLSAGLIRYELDDGDAGEEVCYWKDMTLVPHLINLLSKRTVRTSLSFAQLREGSSNRKELARQLHSAVLKLRETPAF
jgi:1-acyl-sn-glycerol-3-phosphate acyltransferase